MDPPANEDKKHKPDEKARNDAFLAATLEGTLRLEKASKAASKDGLSDEVSWLKASSERSARKWVIFSGRERTRHAASTRTGASIGMAALILVLMTPHRHNGRDNDRRSRLPGGDAAR